MKSYTNLFETIASFDNLLAAARRAALGKRGRPPASSFVLDLEREVLALHEELQTGTYAPGPYATFTIHDPKERLISSAPFRDRVVHHALCRVIEPLFERRFIFDSYANRVGKGTHRAMDRFRHFCRGTKYALKCDVRKFFPSIDHEILIQKIGRVIRCRRTMWLVRTIVSGSNPQEPVYGYFPGDGLFAPYERQRGLPIGNLTSQFFANIYLDGLDHFVKEELRVRRYVRYVDDFVLFGHDKRELRAFREAVERRLQRDRLKLHPGKTRVYRTSDGIEFLGFRIGPSLVRIKRASVRRFCTRMRRLARLYHRGETDLAHVTASVRSWLAHAAYGDTAALVGSLMPRFAFVRGAAVK